MMFSSSRRTTTLILVVVVAVVLVLVVDAQSYIELRSSGTVVTLQTRASSGTICQSVCPAYAVDTWALVGFTGSPLQSWSGFTPSTTPVYVGSNYIGTANDLLSGTILMTLEDAGIPLTPSVFFPTGLSGNVCNALGIDWVSGAIGTADVALIPFRVTNVLQAGSLSCADTTPFLGHWLCGCYFSTSPTRNPTKKPTGNPTNNPTQNPTLKPTQNPTFFQAGSQLVKLPKGTQIRLSKSVRYDGTPTKLEVVSSGSYQRVVWANVTWTRLGVTQSLIPECNPVPNLIPGDWPNPEGSCPCIEVGCTTQIPVPGLALSFSSLRCCITSKAEVLFQGGTSLPPEVWVQNATLGTMADQQQTFTVGVIRCNNPIERELNCQFWRQAPSTYQLQCSTSPIDCYRNQTLGYAFGLFWDRNPKFPYTGGSYESGILPEGQLRGIASILNNKVYSRGGVLVDPLDPKLLAEYYWLGSFSPEQEQAWPFRGLLMPDIIQMRPANWFLNLYQDGDLDPLPCLLNPLSPTCEFLTWQNLTGPEFKLPGLWLLVDTNLTIYPQQWLIEGPGQGVEIWQGTTLLYQNLTAAARWVVQLETQPPVKIRILIKGQIWDIPAAQLSPSWPLPPDSLWSQVQMGNLQYPYLQLVSATQRGALGDWPFLNQSWVTPSLRLKFTLSPQRWDALSELIVEQNIYPYNIPLALEASLYYQTRAVNLSSAEDHDYLRLIWATHLARRHPSEDGDCRTFDLGGITFYDPEESYTQRWYEAEPGVDDVKIPPGAREGGCRCDPLWDPQVACGVCLEGLGVEDCRIVFGPDPVPGAPPAECAGHGVSIRNSTQAQQLLWLWGGKFTFCQALLFQGGVFELVGRAGQGAAFLFQRPQEEIVYLQGQLFYQLLPLDTVLIQEQPPVWDTQLGLVECLGAYRRAFLMNAPYVIQPLKAQLTAALI